MGRECHICAIGAPVMKSFQYADLGGSPTASSEQNSATFPTIHPPEDRVPVFVHVEDEVVECIKERRR
jgi:hypothetical protein